MDQAADMRHVSSVEFNETTGLLTINQHIVEPATAVEIYQRFAEMKGFEDREHPGKFKGYTRLRNFIGVTGNSDQLLPAHIAINTRVEQEDRTNPVETIRLPKEWKHFEPTYGRKKLTDEDLPIRLSAAEVSRLLAKVTAHGKVIRSEYLTHGNGISQDLDQAAQDVFLVNADQMAQEHAAKDNRWMSVPGELVWPLFSQQDYYEQQNGIMVEDPPFVGHGVHRQLGRGHQLTKQRVHFFVVPTERLIKSFPVLLGLAEDFRAFKRHKDIEAGMSEPAPFRQEARMAPVQELTR